MWASLDIIWLEESDIDAKCMEASKKKKNGFAAACMCLKKSLVFSSFLWQNYTSVGDYVEN
jgi:hypothetical protein